MDKTELEGNWEKQKAKLKQKYAKLTDDDLEFIEGKKEEMLAKLQIIFGKTREELIQLIEKL